MDAIKTISLGDFGPRSLWYASVGVPAGDTIDLFWDGEDTESGAEEPMAPWDMNSCLPVAPDNSEPGDDPESSPWWELIGTVDESGEWTWDGEGEAVDFNRNTLLRLSATPWTA